MVAVSLRTISSNGLWDTTLILRTATSIVGIVSLQVPGLDDRGEHILRRVLSAWLWMRIAFVNVRGGRAIDQETQ